MYSFSCGRTLSFFLGLYLGAEVLGHMVTLGFTVGGTASPYSTDHMPPSSSDFCTPPPTLILVCLVYDSRSGGCGVGAHCGFHLCFPLANAIEHLFMSSAAPHTSSLEGCLFGSFAHCFTRSFVVCTSMPPTVRSPPTVHPTSCRVTLHPCQHAEG